MNSIERTFFGKPIREGTTDCCYPNKMTLNDFMEVMRGNLDGFAGNMIREGGPEIWTKPKYMEDWVEMWLAWSEIEQER